MRRERIYRKVTQLLNTKQLPVCGMCISIGEKRKLTWYEGRRKIHPV
jgi:hypothetical protein